MRGSFEDFGEADFLAGRVTARMEATYSRLCDERAAFSEALMALPQDGSEDDRHGGPPAITGAKPQGHEDLMEGTTSFARGYQAYHESEDREAPGDEIEASWLAGYDHAEATD